HRLSDNVLTLTKGDHVLIERGLRAGDVYEYLGDTFTVDYDYASSATTQIEKGDRVLVDGDTVYEFIGDSPLPSTNLANVDYANPEQWMRVTALQQDYANPDLFRRVDIERDAMRVAAYAEDSGIDATGALTVAAA